MSSDIGAELRVAELAGLDDWRLWALGGAVVARLEAAIQPVVGNRWDPGSFGVDAVWSRAAGADDAPLATVLERFEVLDTDAIESSVGGLWLVQAFKVAMLNLVDPVELSLRVSLASGSAVGAWEMFAEYEMQDDDTLDWAGKYSSVPALVEVGAQRVDLAMVRLDWDSESVTEVLRSRAAAIGAWQANRLMERGGEDE